MKQEKKEQTALQQVKEYFKSKNVEWCYPRGEEIQISYSGGIYTNVPIRVCQTNEDQLEFVAIGDLQVKDELELETLRLINIFNLHLNVAQCTPVGLDPETHTVVARGLLYLNGKDWTDDIMAAVEMVDSALVVARNCLSNFLNGKDDYDTAAKKVIEELAWYASEE